MRIVSKNPEHCISMNRENSVYSTNTVNSMNLMNSVNSTVHVHFGSVVYLACCSFNGSLKVKSVTHKTCLHRDRY